MFLGHFAVGFAAKRAVPEVSLGTLFAAAAFLDLLWPVLVLLGIERVAVAPGNTAFTPLSFDYYPWSHSLLMSAVWALACGGVYFLVRRAPRAGLVLGLLVFSHWLLDLVAHRPDLPLYPGGTALLGLGLWNSVAGTLVVELALFAAGLSVYVRMTRPLGGRGRWGLVTLVAFLLVIFAGAAFGPPPPTATAVAWSDMGQWLIILWAAWVDQGRTAGSHRQCQPNSPALPAAR